MALNMEKYQKALLDLQERRKQEVARTYERSEQTQKKYVDRQAKLLQRLESSRLHREALDAQRSYYTACDKSVDLDMKRSRSSNSYSWSDTQLRQVNTPNRSRFYGQPYSDQFEDRNHLPDPVSDMLHGIMAVLSKRYASSKLYKQAHALERQITNRTMTKETYKAIIDGTHSIFIETKEMRFDIGAGLIYKCHRPWIGSYVFE